MVTFILKWHITKNIYSFYYDLKFSIEYIKDLQTEQALLQSVKTQAESETQKLQRKLTVMTELYPGNEMKLRR